MDGGPGVRMWEKCLLGTGSIYTVGLPVNKLSLDRIRVACRLIPICSLERQPLSPRYSLGAGTRHGGRHTQAPFGNLVGEPDTIPGAAAIVDVLDGSSSYIPVF